MIIQTQANCSGIKLAICNPQSNQEIGRVFLYIMHNNLHKKPFALMEDLYIDEQERSQGLGKQLIKKVIELAQNNNCYKLIATSRYSRSSVHELYQKLGFVDYGKEFRLDF